MMGHASPIPWGPASMGLVLLLLSGLLLLAVVQAVRGLDCPEAESRAAGEPTADRLAPEQTDAGDHERHARHG